jgi:flavin-dependent dehydrogenase
MRCDVLVAGGGPAGSAAAISLARLGHTIVLVDRERPAWRRLGESLAPSAVTLLRELGLEPSSVLRGQLACCSMQSSWGRDALRHTDLTLHPYGCAWHIDRRAFDAALLTAAEDVGVRVLRSAWLRCVAAIDGPQWHVELGTGATLEAAWLVDATGRTAVVARSVGAVRARSTRLTALGAHVDASHPLTETDSLVEACPSGWWFSAHMPQGRMAVALFCDPWSLPKRRADRGTFWQTALVRTEHTKRRVAATATPSRLFAAVADSARLKPVTGAGWTAVGDAAFAVDPLSSFGVCHALETGMRAATAIDSALRGDGAALNRYAQLVESRFHESERLRLSFYAMERRFPNAPFWQSVRSTRAPMRSAGARQ